MDTLNICAEIFEEVFFFVKSYKNGAPRSDRQSHELNYCRTGVRAEDRQSSR